MGFMAFFMTIFGMLPTVFAFEPESPQACIQQVCGPMAHIPNPLMELADFSIKVGNFDPIFDEQVAPLLNKWIETIYRTSEMKIAFLKSNIENLYAKTLTPKELLFINFIKAFEIVGEYSNHFEASDGKMKFKWESFTELAKTKNSSVLEKEISLTEKILNSPATLKKSRVQDLPAWAVFRLEYEDADFEEALRTDIKKIDKLIGQIVKQVPAAGSFLFDSNYVSVKSVMSLDKNSSEKYFQFRYVVEIFSEYLNDNFYKHFRQSPIGLRNEVKKRGSFDGIIQNFTQSTTPKAVKYQRSEVFDSCKKRLRQAYYSSPSEYRLRGFTRDLESLKILAEDLITTISGVAISDAHATLRSLQFHLPLSKQKYVSSFIERLHSELNNEYRSEVRLYPLSLDNESLTIEMLMGLLTFEKEDQSKSLLNGIIEFCENETPLAFPEDFSLSGRRSINASWYSLYYPSQGLSVIAHEMGHAVGDFLDEKNDSLKVLLPSRVQCLIDMHPEKKKSVFLSDLQKYVSEDFADTFAARLMLRAKKVVPTLEKGSTNFACSFLNRSNLQFDQAGLKLTNSDESDTHSNNFFRALNWELNQSALPQQCHRLIMENPEMLAPRRCLD